ncbi:MAG: non-canonical purine NTP pyrophosphatase [Candidatus Saccharimonadaceae bacterium]
MNEILLVTGNAHKLREWQQSMPPEITLNSVDIDVAELQSDDPLEIVTDKARRAYALVAKPVIVEDVSAGLVALGGLPGPFIKFFMKKLGQDALYQLAGQKEGTRAIVSCAATYYDGEKTISVRGDVKGIIVAPRGDSAFGFDVTFVPDGYEQTYAEMDAALKNTISHRALAIAKLLNELKANQVI